MFWVYCVIMPVLVLALALVGGILLNGGLTETDDGDIHAD